MHKRGFQLKKNRLFFIFVLLDNLGDKGKGKENEKIANLTVKGFFFKGNISAFDFDFDGETGQFLTLYNHKITNLKLIEVGQNSKFNDKEYKAEVSIDYFKTRVILSGYQKLLNNVTNKEGEVIPINTYKRGHWLLKTVHVSHLRLLHISFDSIKFSKKLGKQRNLQMTWIQRAMKNLKMFHETISLTHFTSTQGNRKEKNMMSLIKITKH